MHNLEEIAHLPQDVARNRQRLDRLGVPAEWGRRDVMAVATTMLTGSSYAVLARAERRPGAVGDVATLAVAAALGGHAVTHGLRAAADRAYNGGAGHESVDAGGVGAAGGVGPPSGATVGPAGFGDRRRRQHSGAGVDRGLARHGPHGRGLSQKNMDSPFMRTR